MSFQSLFSNSNNDMWYSSSIGLSNDCGQYEAFVNDLLQQQQQQQQQFQKPSSPGAILQSTSPISTENNNSWPELNNNDKKRQLQQLNNSSSICPLEVNMELVTDTQFFDTLFVKHENPCMREQAEQQQRQLLA
eukprot:Pgem_evm1s9303